MGPVTFALALAYASLALLLVIASRRSDARGPRSREHWPDIDVVLPARNEEQRLPAALASLEQQDYPGGVTVWVVDDRSDDGTAGVVERALARSTRLRLVRVGASSRRLSPKVNAVARGVAAGSAAWIVTTDADCVHPTGWLRELMLSARESDVMVLGYTETARKGAARGLLANVEALDWVSLMLTNRALISLGAVMASSANNQAYRRDAFERAGGFGVAGRAPSGDEDLLAQRLGRLPGATVAFADTIEARVATAPSRSWLTFLRQRRRWVSRYLHPQHYRPSFLSGIALLGLHSLSLSIATLTSPWWSSGHAWLLGAWSCVLLVVVPGMHLGLARLGRRDLSGWPVVTWAVLHPFVITIASLWALLRPGSWRDGAEAYRLRAWRAWLRRVRRRRVSSEAR